MSTQADTPALVFSAVALGVACGWALVLALALRNAVGTGIEGWSIARNRALVALKWVLGFCIWYLVVTTLASRSQANGGSHAQLLLATSTAALSTYLLRALSVPIGSRLRTFLESWQGPR